MSFQNFFKSDEWKILWPFYISDFIYTLFFFFGPYWIIYFLDIGLSFKQISILVATFTFVPLIFEIPTGAIADIFGRKFSVILSYFLAGIFTILIPFFPNFYILVLLFFFISVSNTLSSGADEAWVVDLLKHNRKGSLVHNFFIKSHSIGAFGIMVMGVLSSLFVKQFGIKWVWVVAGFGALLAGLILLKANEHFKTKRLGIKRTIIKTISNSKKGIIYSTKHSVLLFILLAFIFISISMAIGSTVWQPFLKEVGLKPYLLGYFYSFTGLVSIGVPFLSKPLLKKIKKERYYLALMSFLMFLILLAIYFANIVLVAILLIIMIWVIDGLDAPVSATFFQKFVPSKIRSTIGSLRSMLTGVGATIGVLIAGVVADIVGPKLTMVYSSFFMIPAIIFYLLIKEKK